MRSLLSRVPALEGKRCRFTEFKWIDACRLDHLCCKPKLLSVFSFDAKVCQGDLKRGLQTAVSQNKRRFIDTEAKFDLDLTYICDRMIAMALPCVDGAMYRNDSREVARFFSTRHYG